MPRFEKIFLSILLVFLSVVGRLIPHPWNMTPVGAAAIFAGVHIGKRAAILIPLLSMLVGDMFLGFYSAPLLFSVYFSMVISGLLAYWTRDERGVGIFVARPIAAATLFYLLTNAAVWMFGSLYPHTPLGLLLAYVAGVPFFAHQVLGDLLYVTLFFGFYAWAGKYSCALKTLNSFVLRAR